MLDKDILQLQINLGKTQEELAVYFNTSESTVRHWMGKHGLKTVNECKPRGSYNEEQINAIKFLFTNDNIGAREISKRLGIKHHATVSKILIRNNLKRGHCVEEQTKSEITFNKDNLQRLWKAAELHLMKLCELSGFRYAIPQDGTTYDLLIDFGNGLKKIQVKSSYRKSEQGPGYIFGLTRTRHNSTINRKLYYKSSDVDYYFLYDVEGGCWLIPFVLLASHKTVTPSLRYPGYKINI